ncbi:hypothetical protein [Streptomyces sp. HUAS TT7]|uniref:hypothetical protein n=1 Tax=Streptomyces sp. HUAS TT7 TaxID=3447507 RepID=UPI003F65A22F
MPSPTAPDCVASAITIHHRAEDAAVQQLCVRPGATVTVVLPPRPGGWPPPHSSSPMLATVTGTAGDPDGTVRVTVRAARTGAAMVTWRTQGAELFTLRLEVAAYQNP